MDKISTTFPIRLIIKKSLCQERRKMFSPYGECGIKKKGWMIAKPFVSLEVMVYVFFIFFNKNEKHSFYVKHIARFTQL